VTTRQTPAVARPATAGAARAGVAEGRRELDVSVEMDDEGQQRPGLSDPRSAEVRPAGWGCRPTLSPIALPVAAERSRRAALTGVGVKQAHLIRPATDGAHAPSVADRHLAADVTEPGVGGAPVSTGRTCSQMTGPSGLARSSPGVATDLRSPVVPIAQPPRWSLRPRAGCASPGAAQAPGGRDLAAGQDDFHQSRASPVGPGSRLL